MKEPYVMPFTGDLSDFPKDTEVPEGAELVQWEDRPGPHPEIHANVVYDRKGDVDLHLQILVPRYQDEPDSIVIASHMDTVTHAHLNREALRKELAGTQYVRQVLIPEDGERIAII